MELRSQKANLGLIVMALVWPLAAQEFHFPARRAALPRPQDGTLHVTAQSIAFAPSKAGRARIEIPWLDVQSLVLAETGEVRVTTYQDRRLYLGKDQSYRFRLAGKPDLRPVYEALIGQLGPRIEAQLAAPAGEASWTIAAKHLKAIRGSEGVLEFYPARVVYRARTKGGSRTWLLTSFTNVSTSGPYQLSLGAGEFQLKQALDQGRFDALWQQLNRPQGLELIANLKEKAK